VTAIGAVQLVVYLLILAAIVRPLGAYLARVFTGERLLLSSVLGPVERGIYRVSGVDAAAEMRWTTYAVAMLLFNCCGVVLLYALQRLQHGLSLNPMDLDNVAPRLAFNTAVSFVTNTNWQAYAGESTVSYLTQMAGLTVQNFVSAATGLAIAIALVRGFARHSARQIGNFWVDLVRGTLYVLLPISVIGCIVLVALGVPQTLHGSVTATGLTGARQLIVVGPVASQEVIKELGTNGGGFFNANSAHPFENPTPLSNLLEMVLILAIPAALTYTFGKMVGNTRQGWAIFATMAILFVVGVLVATVAEQHGNDLFRALHIDQTASHLSAGGNMEGKEVRFGINSSALFAVITTVASCGAVNAMHDSFTPLGGLIPLANIGLGEVIFGGVGAGLYGILLYAIAAIFIAGLMVGRTPEYLGKKIEPYDVKMTMLALLILPLVILGFAGVTVITRTGLASVLNPGPHGLSEILYAFTSGAGNNGSAFAGRSANTPCYDRTMGIAMLAGRFLMIVPILALAGSLAAKKRLTATAGTFPTTGPLWVGLLAGVILIVGAVTYVPAYSLGPIVEQRQMTTGVTFDASTFGTTPYQAVPQAPASVP
jgi:K+-transporting ATPase ATPase A chain